MRDSICFGFHLLHSHPFSWMGRGGSRELDQSELFLLWMEDWLLLPSQWGICYNMSETPRPIKIHLKTCNLSPLEKTMTTQSDYLNITKKKYTYTNILLFDPQLHFTQQVLSLLKNYFTTRVTVLFPFPVTLKELFCYPVRCLDVLPGSHTFHLFPQDLFTTWLEFSWSA